MEKLREEREERKETKDRGRRENKKSNGVFFFLSLRTKLSFRMKLVGFKMF